MSRPKGLPKTGGRQKGTANKATADIREACRKHGPKAISGLAKIAENEKHPGQIAAIRELLDRGYGKPAQAVTGEDGEGPVQIRFLMDFGPPPNDGA